MKKNILITAVFSMFGMCISLTAAAQSSTPVVQPGINRVSDVDPVSTDSNKAFITDEKGEKVFFAADPYAVKPANQERKSEEPLNPELAPATASPKK